MRAPLALRPSSVAVLALAFVAASASAAAAAEVRALNGWFDPARVEVDAGSSVTFANADDRWHTVTSGWDDGASFDHVIQPGENVTVRFDEAGTWRVYCVPHAWPDANGTWQGMAADVVVADAPAEALGPEAEVREAPFPALVAVSVALLAAATRRARRA